MVWGMVFVKMCTWKTLRIDEREVRWCMVSMTGGKM